MRLARTTDIYPISELYNDAIAYAESVGHIDWESLFPAAQIEKWMLAHELFCFEEDNHLAAVAKLAESSTQSCIY
ncbi:MAG: hypothetical protein ABI303_01095 [Candidatus Saccharimonas sp.]